MTNPISMDTTDYRTPIPVLPTMVNVVGMGFIGLVAFNGLLQVPGVGPQVAKFRQWTHRPFQVIGGPEFMNNPHRLELGDAGLSFMIDAVVSTGIVALVGHTKAGARIYNKMTDFTDRQCENLTKLGDKLLGRPAAPAVG